MKTREEILDKIDQWEKSLSSLDDLLLSTESGKVRDTYLIAKRELEDSVKLLKWVVY